MSLWPWSDDDQQAEALLRASTTTSRLPYIDDTRVKTKSSSGRAEGRHRETFQRHTPHEHKYEQTYKIEQRKEATVQEQTCYETPYIKNRSPIDRKECSTRYCDSCLLTC